MKRLFWIMSVLMVTVMFSRARLCLADRFMTDPLFSSAPIIDSDSKAKSQGSSDSDDEDAQKPDPFAAERQVVLKGKKAATDIPSDKSAADKSAKPLVSDQKPEAGAEKNDSASKDSSASSSKKQPSMYYYQ